MFGSYMCRSILRSRKNLNKLYINKINSECISSNRNNHTKKNSIETSNSEIDDHNLPSGFIGNYKVFKDEESSIIFDVNEEKKRIELGELDKHEYFDPYEEINLTHGVNGVYDIEDLIQLLRKDNAKQIFVATVPKEYSYVDYIVIVSGKSHRHMHALASFVRKVFKMKRYKHEIIPKIEGKDSNDWIALDLGNIALHILSQEARTKYDLETLWSVGSKFDDISNEKNDDLDIMNKYNAFLKDLQPAE